MLDIGSVGGSGYGALYSPNAGAAKVTWLSFATGSSTATSVVAYDPRGGTARSTPELSPAVYGVARDGAATYVLRLRLHALQQRVRRLDRDLPAQHRQLARRQRAPGTRFMSRRATAMQLAASDAQVLGAMASRPLAATSPNGYGHHTVPWPSSLPWP